MRDLTDGRVFANSGHPKALGSKMVNKTMTYKNFKKWCKMSGPISKGHFIWIPNSDLYWTDTQREFGLWGDEVELIREF